MTYSRSSVVYRIGHWLSNRIGISISGNDRPGPDNAPSPAASDHASRSAGDN
jgi:hypothetical protein